jgi:hypothetical protein
MLAVDWLLIPAGRCTSPCSCSTQGSDFRPSSKSSAGGSRSSSRSFWVRWARTWRRLRNSSSGAHRQLATRLHFSQSPQNYFHLEDFAARDSGCSNVSHVCHTGKIINSLLSAGCQIIFLIWLSSHLLSVFGQRKLTEYVTK